MKPDWNAGGISRVLVPPLPDSCDQRNLPFSRVVAMYPAVLKQTGLNDQIFTRLPYPTINYTLLYP